MTDPPEMPQPGDVLLFAHATGLEPADYAFSPAHPITMSRIYAGDFHVVGGPSTGRRLSRSARAGGNAFLRDPSQSRRAREGALAWAKSQIGGKYDRWDVLVIILEHVFTHLHLNYAPPGRFSCGEFVARAFQEAGVRLFPDRDTADIVPADFARLLPPDAQPHNLV